MKFLLIILAVVLYLGVSEMNAKRKAEAFCDSVNVGDSTDDLLERGLAAGARERSSSWVAHPNSPRQLFITFTGFAPGSDFLCGIAERDAVVVDKVVLARSLITQRR